ncbi:hypothetical protein FN846DRAFT_773401, partial [Sphaerosporella brunnea]
TAPRWLEKLGFKYGQVRKGVYIDGHERADVVSYRNDVFILRWKDIERRLVVFNEDGTWQLPPNLREGETPLVLITHDESTFNANDGKRKVWMENGKQPLRPKTKGKGIMVSAFLTPGGILKVPDTVSDAELLRNPMWRNNYWTGDKMVEHTIQSALPILRYAFPGCHGFWAFDNATNHNSYHPKALVASRM